MMIELKQVFSGKRLEEVHALYETAFPACEKKPFSMRMLGSSILSGAIWLTTGVKVNDPTSGMRMFSQKMIKEFADGLNYGPEPDTISYLIKQGAKVSEIPVTMDERILGESYLNPVNAARYMGKMLFSILLVQSFRIRNRG